MNETVGQPFRHHRSELPPKGDIGFGHAHFTSGNNIVDHDLMAILADYIALVNFVVFCRQLESDEALFDFAIGIKDRSDDKFNWLGGAERAQVGPDMPPFATDRVAS